MFRRIARQVVNGAEALVNLHPVELMGLLEQGWNVRAHPQSIPPTAGHPNHRSDVPGVGIQVLPSPVITPPALAGAIPGPAAPFTTVLARNVPSGARWDHLIYAYMIENTRIYEIFRRVVSELLHGEKLGTPGLSTLRWLRNTEELFYRDPPPFSIATLSSHIRPDLRASRRNAYQRMFGMDLNHGADDNSPYPYVRADASNKEFVPTFEELLREVWIGHINRTTTSGANPTDDTKIEELARKLHDMLITRRQSGNLSREEFVFVAMMSWFHLTVDNDLQIIRDLRADGTSPEQRLFKIAQVVGLPAHGLSRSYFEVADDISTVLTAIETGALHVSGAARTFYDPAVLNSLAGIMTRIITHWSLITGRDIKAGKVAPS
jgi:hypothetical protein